MCSTPLALPHPPPPCHPTLLPQTPTLQTPVALSPTAHLLIRDLSLRVVPGMRVLVTGDNGCGKSSLLRVVAGLWHASSGQVHTPLGVVYLPQRAYVPVYATLRQQLVYGR